MRIGAAKTEGRTLSRRLSKEDRRRHLLDTALLIVREEGADRLTLGHLAERAGVSKPIAYDHFGTRAGLLIELYKMRNAQQINALKAALTTAGRDAEGTITTLANNYIHSSIEMCGEWHAVSAALSGSEETELAYQQMLDSYVKLFAAALGPFSTLPPSELELRCVGVIGAGEALMGTVVRGNSSQAEIMKAFAAFIPGILQ